MKSPLRVFLGGIGGAFVALLISQAISSAGTISIATGTIPFRGTLEKNGQPFTGEVDMNFKLYDAETDGTQRWSEEHSPSKAASRKRISVYKGEFVAPLGAYDDGLGGDDLPEILGDAEPLWVEVEVRLAGESSYTKLTGRQRLTASPYSITAGRSSSLTVASLTVGGKVTSTSDATVASAIYLSQNLARFAVGVNETGRTGPHMIVFGDPGTGSNDGGQLRYDTSTNAIDFERTSDSLAAFTLDLDDGTLTVAGALHPAQTTQDTSTASAAVTLGSSADLLLDTVANISFTASTANNGVAFGDSDGGLQLVYNPTLDDVIVEKGTTTTNATLDDGSDVLLIDRNGTTVGIKGDMVTGGYPVPTTGTWSSPTTLENNALDKVFQSDTSCTAGHIRVAKDGGKWASLCVCLGATADNGRGYYCFD